MHTYVSVYTYVQHTHLLYSYIHAYSYLHACKCTMVCETAIIHDMIVQLDTLQSFKSVSALHSLYYDNLQYITVTNAMAL